MEIIDELETVRRGLYGGATGYLDFGGNMNFCITIRTMIKKGDKVYPVSYTHLDGRERCVSGCD